jgi:pimeloyl-ACP methyl ester carboxylesterase
MDGNQRGVLFNDLNACNQWKGGAEAIKNVKCRVLVVFGDNDQMTPAERRKWVADSIKDSKMVILKDCGRMMMREQPEQTLDALISEF